MDLDFKSVDATFLFDTFLLLLIGIGPKLALVPFLDMTADMPIATKRLVLRRRLTTAGIVAACLLALGGFLTRLLHFSTGALSIASGLILFLTAIRMVLVRDAPDVENRLEQGMDPMQLAVV